MFIGNVTVVVLKSVSLGSETGPGSDVIDLLQLTWDFL